MLGAAIVHPDIKEVKATEKDCYYMLQDMGFSESCVRCNAHLRTDKAADCPLPLSQDCATGQQPVPHPFYNPSMKFPRLVGRCVWEQQTFIPSDLC